MRPLLAVIAVLIAWTTLVTSKLAAADAVPSSGYRALVIVETSKEMANREDMVIQSLDRLVVEQFKTFLGPGDALEFWTFGKRLRIDAVPPKAWDPEEAKPMASEMAQAFVTTDPVKEPDLGLVMAALPGISRGVKDNVVFLMVTGEQMIRGTPLDNSVNKVFLAHAPGMKKARKPFVLVLVARDGKWVGQSISPGGHAVHIPAVAFRTDKPEETQPLETKPSSAVGPVTLLVPEPTIVGASSGTVSTSENPGVILQPEEPVEVSAAPQPVKATAPHSVDELTAMIADQQQARQVEKATRNRVEAEEAVAPRREVSNSRPPIASVPTAADPAPNTEAGPEVVVAVEESRLEQTAKLEVADRAVPALTLERTTLESRGEQSVDPVLEVTAKMDRHATIQALEPDGEVSEAVLASTVESPEVEQESSMIAVGKGVPPREPPAVEGGSSARGRRIPVGWLNLSLGALLLGSVVLLGWTLRRRANQRFEPSFISRSFDRNR